MYSRDVLIDLDALLDTRLGLAHVLVPDLADKLNIDLYRMRVTEAWAGVVGIKDWKAQWRARDKSVLKHAEPTRLFYEIVDAIDREHTVSMLGAPTAKPTVTINIQPYDIRGEELSILTDAMKNWFHGYDIKVIRSDLIDLTPEFLNRHWDTWFTYDWFHWIELHASKLETPIPRFVLNAPALLDDIKEPEPYEALKKDGGNPFEAAKKFMSPYITLESLDAVMYSLANVVE